MIVHPAHLKESLRIAVIVGVILFAINQLDFVLRGQSDWEVWIKGAMNFVVPFCVANLGILTATRRKSGER